MPKKIVVILLLAAATISIILFTPVFKITSIEANPLEECTKGQNILSEQKGKNILVANTQELQKTLREKFPCLENVTVTKKYTNKLIVTLEAKKTIATIDGTEFALDETGLVSVGQLKDLPKIFIPQELKLEPGKAINEPTILYALKLTKLLEKSDFIPSNIRILDYGDIAIYNNNQAVAIFSKEKDASAQVDSLQSVLAKAKIDASKIAKIDLRFEMPIITTNK